MITDTDMRVWVLETGIYDTRYVAGVFSSAQAAMDAHGKGLWSLTDPNDPDGQWSNDLDWDSHAEVTPWDVDEPAA